MIISNNIGTSIEVVLSGVVTTNELQCIAVWSDLPAANYPSGQNAIETNGTTPVELVPAIQDNKRRELKYVSVYNSDTVQATVTINLNVSGTLITIIQFVIESGWTIFYDNGGWKVLTSMGAEPAEGSGSFLEIANNLSDVANATTAFNNIKQAATETYSGVLEIATQAEANTGTDDARAITPLKLKTAGDLRYQPLDSDLTDLSTKWAAASASGGATLLFSEDTDNGSNKVTLKSAESLAADYISTLPSSTGTLLNDTAIGVTVQAWDADLDAYATAPISNIVLTGGDFTTTSATAVNITGLVSGTLAANTRYRVKGFLSIGCSGIGGVAFAVVIPTGATMKIKWFGFTVTSGTYNDRYTTTSGTLTGIAYCTVISANGFVYLDGEISTGANTGTAQYQCASGTALQTSTVFQLGSNIQMQKVG